MIPLFSAIFFIILLIQAVRSEGTVSLHVQSYNNPLSEAVSGETCAGQCVNTLTITLYKSVSVGGSILDEVQRISSSNNIGDVESFSSTLGPSWSNPLLFTFAGEVSVKFKVEVVGVEKNYPNNEYLMAEFSFNQSGIFHEEITLSSGSASLTFSYNASCAADYYGTCEISCVARDNTAGHYTCDPATGYKICHEGWTGDQCHISTDTTNDHSTVESQKTGETNSVMKISISTLWKIAAICFGILLGSFIIVVWIWYKVRYKKRKAGLPTIIVSNEKFFRKTGITIPAEETKAEGSTASTSVASCANKLSNQAVPSKFRSLASTSIPNLNNQNTPPPVEDPEQPEC